MIAFFPCIRFENQCYMMFQGTQYQLKNKSDEYKLEYNLQLHKELHEMYNLITKLVLICLKKNIPLVIENPYSLEHYLTRYWSLRPKVIDKDRTLNGDYYVKPTQYWFVNCEPKQNLIFEPIQLVKQKKITALVKNGGISNTVERSLIHPQYANRFIRQFILEENN